MLATDQTYLNGALPTRARAAYSVIRGVLMKFDEIKQRYPDQWVLIEFTKLDDELKVAEGRVIAHARSRDEIEKELMVLRNGRIAVEYTGEWDPDEAYLL